MSRTEGKAVSRMIRADGGGRGEGGFHESGSGLTSFCVIMDRQHGDSGAVAATHQTPVMMIVLSVSSQQDSALLCVILLALRYFFRFRLPRA